MASAAQMRDAVTAVRTRLGELAERTEHVAHRVDQTEGFVPGLIDRVEAKMAHLSAQLDHHRVVAAATPDPGAAARVVDAAELIAAPSRPAGLRCRAAAAPAAGEPILPQ